MTADPFPCVELDCGYLSVRTLAECEKARCPWTYTRRREEDLIEREKKDARLRDPGTPRLQRGRNVDETALNPLEMCVPCKDGGKDV
jgi:hypothetical protein